MSEKRTGTVKFRLDAENPPKLTPRQKSRLDAIPNKAIDYGDVKSQTNMVWTQPGALIPVGNKQQLTVRLDADVLEFFKRTGTRYQSRINAALREYMNAHKKAV